MLTLKEYSEQALTPLCDERFGKQYMEDYRAAVENGLDLDSAIDYAEILKRSRLRSGKNSVAPPL